MPPILLWFHTKKIGKMNNISKSYNNLRVRKASEILSGITQSKIGDICLYIYTYIYKYVICRPFLSS